MKFQEGSLFVTAPHRPERMVLAHIGSMLPLEDGEPIHKFVCLNKVCPDIHMGDFVKILKASFLSNDLKVPKKLNLASIPIYEGGESFSFDKPVIIHRSILRGPETVNLSPVHSLSYSMKALSYFLKHSKPGKYKVVLNHLDYFDSQLDHDYNELAIDNIPARADLIFPKDGLSGDALWEKAHACVDGPLRRQYYNPILIHQMTSLRHH